MNVKKVCCLTAACLFFAAPGFALETPDWDLRSFVKLLLRLIRQEEILLLSGQSVLKVRVLPKHVFRSSMIFQW